MPDLDLLSLPAELQAALERAWPGCPEAQRRALLAPAQLGWPPVWPHGLWAWRRTGHWWRPFAARAERERAEAFFGAHLGDARGERWDGVPTYAERLFDPNQPFFDTPWTHADRLLRSPAPEAFSDADFWFITQLLHGGDLHWATVTAQDWARGLAADRALRGGRRGRWLHDAQWRLHMSATGAFT
ncbi:hypothetical protein [Pelomonas cellulosilytica]|uniref:Heparinase n=1 Tax=Pelomonas cellulosilytica TaxID=2906762 RepID=A0ABS8XXG2_9BURK|nr:hypothetical protein [Pelomonas sp. P8]MCE4555466.1 hypothetical protein [Pelomonas sp. P8]